MKEIYEKFINGDLITDEELDEAVEFFDDLRDRLFMLGPTFNLAAKEANRVYFSLRGFQDARKER